MLLGVSGSVAAYKAAVVARLLIRQGAKVEVMLTRSAEHFVGASTFAGITGRPAVSDMFSPSIGGELHVDLARASELILLVPATADLIARLAGGRADDLVTATALCARCPVLAAPAMHPAMWAHKATQRNVDTLMSDGRIRFVGPVEGEVASGEVGVGRMAEPEDIVTAALRLLSPPDLAGQRVVITAGPTVEDLDPVRFIGNRSSGKMGFALAERAAARGARVTLISGPVSRPTPPLVRRVDVRSALEMSHALDQALGKGLSEADALLMAAAVGDYRPSETRTAKIKRRPGTLRLELVPNPDLLLEVAKRRRGKTPLLVGFAVETGADAQVIDYAQKKLRTKRVDLIVANRADESMGRDDNRVTLVTESEPSSFGPAPKRDVADRILDWVVARLGAARR